jgi:anaerobic magnesium-protoporphyrin IX monomethyl ester cyclase
MVTKELLLKMKEAGCFTVWFGVEAGTQNVLDDMRKGITLAQTIRAFKWCKEAGLKPDPNAVLGFPGETKETAWATIKFVERLNPDNMGNYTVATPYPGTPLYDFIKEKGWLKVTDYDKYDRVTPTFETPTLSMKELGEIRERAFLSFYIRPAYILRMYAKGGIYGLAATKTAFIYLFIAISSKLQLNNLPAALKAPSKSHF